MASFACTPFPALPPPYLFSSPFPVFCFQITLSSLYAVLCCLSTASEEVNCALYAFYLLSLQSAHLPCILQTNMANYLPLQTEIQIL